MIYDNIAPVSVGFDEVTHTVISRQSLFFDTMDDFDDLPDLTHTAPGSEAYCVETHDVYILNSLGEWVVQ